MIKFLKRLFRRGVRDIEDIVSPLNKIVRALEENTQAAGNAALKMEIEAEEKLKAAQQKLEIAKAQGIELRVQAGALYDTASASTQRAQKLREIFG